jgi:hypothetical protein
MPIRAASFSSRPAWVAALAALPLALAAPAGAAQFGTPFAISAAGAGSHYVQAAIGADGGAAFAWRGATGQVHARNRSATDVLGPIRDLSEPGVVAHDPHMAVDGDGAAVVVWTVPIGANYRVQARTLSAASALSSTQTLSPIGYSGERPYVAVDPDGDAVAAWMRTEVAEYRIQAGSRSAAGALGPIKTLSKAGQQALFPKVAVDADGDAVIAWMRFDGMHYRVQARTLSADGVTGPVRTLSKAGADAWNPRVAIDADGDALIVWRRHDGAHIRVQARALSKTGVLGPVQSLSAAGRSADNPEVAMDADGDAIAVWQDQYGTTWRVQTRTRSKSGALGAIQTLSKAGQSAFHPQVAADADGDAAFVWAYLDGSHYRVQARFRSKAGALGKVRTLSPTGVLAGGQRVVMDADGGAVAIWYQFDGSYTVWGAATP